MEFKNYAFAFSRILNKFLVNKIKTQNVTFHPRHTFLSEHRKHNMHKINTKTLSIFL